MRKRGLIIRYATILLLVIFSQKMGAGLLLHNLLHTGANTTGKQAAPRDISYSCTCIDDFLMPFEETDEHIVAVPLTIHSLFIVFANDNIPFYPVAHSTLRGPPSRIA